MIDGMNNFVQVFNELAILVVYCFAFTFTEGVGDPVMRYTYGWWFLYSMYINLFVNGSIITYFITKKVYELIKLRWSWHLFHGRRNKILAHNKLIINNAERLGKTPEAYAHLLRKDPLEKSIEYVGDEAVSIVSHKSEEKVIELHPTKRRKNAK